MRLVAAGRTKAWSRARGAANLWVPADDVVYVAPELVLHYVTGHKYLPPLEFIDAVMACPEQGSAAYMNRMSRFF